VALVLVYLWVCWWNLWVFGSSGFSRFVGTLCVVFPNFSLFLRLFVRWYILEGSPVVDGRMTSDVLFKLVGFNLQHWVH
jgi:hypothetical protein